MDDNDLWLAHEQPQRQLAFGAWLCDCDPCFEVLRSSLVARPDLRLVLKSAMDRRIVSAKVALAVHDSGDDLESLLIEPWDWLREIFVAQEAVVARKRKAAAAPRKKAKKPHLRLLPNPPAAVAEWWLSSKRIWR